MPNCDFPEILRDPIFSDVSIAEDDIERFLWKIDTKYYETTINLCPLKSEIVPPASLLNLTEALVLYFDSENVSILFHHLPNPIGFFLQF